MASAGVANEEADDLGVDDETKEVAAARRLNTTRKGVGAVLHIPRGSERS